MAKKGRQKDQAPDHPRHTKRAFFALSMLTAALLLAFLAWWGYSSVMEYVLGRYDVLETKGAASVLYGKPKVLLLNPVRTELWLMEDPEDTTWPYRNHDDDWPLADTLWYADGMPKYKKNELEAWEIIGDVEERSVDLDDFWADALYERGYNYHLVEEDALPTLKEDFPDYDMLIIPGAMLLSYDERQGIKAFLAQDRELLCTWLVGCRDENGDWVGFDFLTQLIGAAPNREVKDVTGGTSVILRGNSPITAGIPPGSHLEIYTYHGYISFNIIEERTRSDGFWFFPYWRTVNDLSPGTDALFAHGHYVTGRFVWFGIVPESVQGVMDNNLLLDRMVENSLKWLHRMPVIVPRVWPGGHRAAGAVALEAHGNPAATQRALTVASEMGTPVDLIAHENFTGGSAPVKGLLKGDLILSTGRYDRLSELPLKDQRAWVEQGAEKLRENTGVKPVGLFPYDWLYNQWTIDAAAQQEMDVILAMPNLKDREWPTPRSYGPEVVAAKPNRWWIFSRKIPLGLLPKAAVSTWEYRQLKGLRGTASILDGMSGDMLRIRKAGGLYLGIVDPEELEAEGDYTLPVKLAGRLDSLGFWRASISEVSNRYAGWRGIRASGKEGPGNRLRLGVANVGRIKLSAVVFDVYLPPLIGQVDVSTHKVGVKATLLRYSPATGICTFQISELSARKNLEVFLDLTRALPSDTLRVKQPPEEEEEAEEDTDEDEEAA